jgi:hypothetical protein
VETRDATAPKPAFVSCVSPGAHLCWPALHQHKRA